LPLDREHKNVFAIIPDSGTIVPEFDMFSDRKWLVKNTGQKTGCEKHMDASLTLETTAYTLDQLISTPAKHIALAGRSNVGKSALINALAGRKQLAKVSSTPGKTRSINFYRVEPYNFYLVDLPGYGYARTSHAEREKWAKMLEHYLLSCQSLRALALLLDCRLPPQKLDRDLAFFAHAAGLEILPVLTKADKCKRSEQIRCQRAWQTLLGSQPLLTSSSKNMGIVQLWEALLSILKA
jgi:GTP-binding protein